MKEKTQDLTLVPINDLFEEIKDRCECFVSIYTVVEDAGDPFIYISENCSNALKKIGLCEYLKSEILEEFKDDYSRP